MLNGGRHPGNALTHFSSWKCVRRGWIVVVIVGSSSRSKKKTTDSASVSDQRADSEHKAGQGRRACERYDDMSERAE